MNKYTDFLKEKIVSTEYKTTASFIEENGQIYIVDEKHKIPFNFLYKDELYDAGIAAAIQLLDVTLMIEHSRGVC